MLKVPVAWRACQVLSGKEFVIMQSQPMRQRESIQPVAAPGPIFVEAERLLDRMKDVYESIAMRAYELFETRGRHLGCEIDDWLRAESETLRPMPVEFTDAGNQFKVVAEVPGFGAKDLKVSVEPNRLIISGIVENKVEKKDEGKIFSERKSREVFRALDLPAEIDTASVTATLKDGILNLTLPKVALPEPKSVEVKIQ